MTGYFGVALQSRSNLFYRIKRLFTPKTLRLGWTEEKRQAAKERINARNLKAVEEADERMRRRRMTRYARDTITGRIHVWTEHYSQMERMQDLGWHDPKYTDVSNYKLPER